MTQASPTALDSSAADTADTASGGTPDGAADEDAPDEQDDLCGQAREWLSLEDPEEHRTWLFDVTFMTSSWTCIYGAGCPGTRAEPAPEEHLGCCDHGAYLSDDHDVAHVRAMIAELDSSLWQRRDEVSAQADGALWRDDEGWWRTKVIDGVCVFQNRADHVSGPGCAFHHLALATGRRPMDTKPEVCWQAPLRREDHETVTGHVYTMVREWERRDWGGPETDMWWWCTESATAHAGRRPVYVALSDELTAICGAQVYAALAEQLDKRCAARTLLPHPTVRQRRPADR